MDAAIEAAEARGPAGLAELAFLCLWRVGQANDLRFLSHCGTRPLDVAREAFSKPRTLGDFKTFGTAPICELVGSDLRRMKERLAAAGEAREARRGVPDESSWLVEIRLFEHLKDPSVLLAAGLAAKGKEPSKTAYARVQVLHALLEAGADEEAWKLLKAAEGCVELLSTNGEYIPALDDLASAVWRARTRRPDVVADFARRWIMRHSKERSKDGAWRVARSIEAVGPLLWHFAGEAECRRVDGLLESWRLDWRR